MAFLFTESDRMELAASGLTYALLSNHPEPFAAVSLCRTAGVGKCGITGTGIRNASYSSPVLQLLVCIFL